MLLTRPEAKSREFARALTDMGIASLTWPLTRIVPATDAVEIPEGTRGLLFTSANAVAAFAALSPNRDLPAFCVGPNTGAAARAAGLADCRVGDGDAEALAQMARTSGIRAFLHPRGAETAGNLAGWLTADGIAVSEVVLYRAEETGPPGVEIAAALAEGRVALNTAWSPRGARLLAEHLRAMTLGKGAFLAISANAAAPLTEAGFAPVLTAEKPNGAAMLQAIRAYFTAETR